MSSDPASPERAAHPAPGSGPPLPAERARQPSQPREPGTGSAEIASFIAMMSHELRTPLNAIGGYAELMRLGVPEPLPPSHRHFVERIERAQRHLLAVIDSLLAHARLEAGRMEYELEALSAGELLASIEPLVRPQLEAKALQYECEPCDPALLVRADPAKVLQVLLNLVGNAIKFTPRGGRVHVAALPAAPDAVELRVRDSGPGIPADKRDAVFEPFVQLRDTTGTSRHGGTGLGLSISRDLARGMGGDLTVDHAPGPGAEFVLRLQRA